MSHFNQLSDKLKETENELQQALAAEKAAQEELNKVKALIQAAENEVFFIFLFISFGLYCC
jgi:chromosome segregation ATPase